ncbi:MAG TPA: aldo/keto reductase [Burkholderiaceae bacterium]|nr:aldo/keto reductase [Burkholderiaceae bacterium]
MEYRNLGRSPLKISPITLGTMMFGGATGTEESLRIIHDARDAGINSMDTADVYNKGETEKVVAQGIKGERDYWVLASKVANPMGEGPNNRGFSRKWVIEGVEASLRRLETDYLDIVYLHRDYPGQSLEEPLRAIDGLIKQGKVRYYGVSNFRGWRIAETVRMAQQLGMPTPSVLQPVYSVVNRLAEMEQLPAAQEYGLGVISYSPLARGVLTGKYRSMEDVPADSRVARADKRILDTEWRAESLVVANAIRERAEARGIGTADFAMAWVMANSLVTSAIAGPRTFEQWKAYLLALDVRLSAEDESFVDDLVTPGYASTHGYHDPAHRIVGRRPIL